MNGCWEWIEEGQAGNGRDRTRMMGVIGGGGLGVAIATYNRAFVVQLSFQIALLEELVCNHVCNLNRKLYHSRTEMTIAPNSIVVYYSNFFSLSKGTVRSETMLVCNRNDGPEFKGAIFKLRNEIVPNRCKLQSLLAVSVTVPAVYYSNAILNAMLLKRQQLL